MTADPGIAFDTPVINETPVPHHCFGCGALNEGGLKLRFRRDPEDGVWAEFVPDQRFEGYLGMVHGGVLTTMVDEAMSWAISASGDFAVTARLTTAFKAPAQVGRRLRVHGRVMATRRRLIDTEARIIDVETEQLIATAEARFMRVSEAQAEAWRASYLGAPAGDAESTPSSPDDRR